MISAKLKPLPYSDLSVVIPTLNEEATIGVLLERLAVKYPGISILVADDGSSDRTAATVREKTKFLADTARIDFFDRASAPKKGLTVSVCEAILRVQTPFVVVMDGDLQHPPEVVGLLLTALRSGSQIVVGTRSRLHWNQPPHRFLITLIFTLMASLTLRFRGIRLSDPMSGLFGASTELFQQSYHYRPDLFVAEGYKVLFDFCRCVQLAACQESGRHRISEVLYDFETRKGGGSKAGARHAIAFLRSLLK